MEYYSHTQKNEISPFAATWLNLECLMPSEISQRKTIIVWYHLYMQFFKCSKQVSMCVCMYVYIYVYIYIYIKQTHRYIKQTSGYPWQGGATQGWGRYKLLGKRQAQGCIVQHGEYSQYSVIIVNGK